jgi:hypothetical protein
MQKLHTRIQKKLSRLSAMIPFAALASACHPRANPTPPPATAPASVVALTGAAVMIGVGDIARCDGNGDELTARIVDSILKADSIAKVPDVVFTLGDNAYTSGSTSQWTNCFTPSWGDKTKRIMRNIRPSPGNHEYYTTGADPYYKYFGDRTGPPGKGYYSYDIGDWHAVVINSEIAVNEGFTLKEQQDQVDWLIKDLKANSKACTVAYWHHPRFSSGSHGTDVKLQPIWQALHDNNADLVLTGHDHHYERFLPMTATGVVDTVKGIASFVIGTGGADLRGLRRPLAANSAARIEGHYGVLLLTLGSKEWRSAFISTNGLIWDPSGGKCH